MAPSESDPQASEVEISSGEIQVVSSASMLVPDDRDSGGQCDESAFLPRGVVAVFVSRPATMGWLTRFVGHRVAPPDVNDLVQDVLLEALRTTAVPSSESALPGWLATIARRTIAMHHERRARRARHEGAMPAARADHSDAYEQKHIPGWKRQRDLVLLVTILLGTALLVLAFAWLLGPAGFTRFTRFTR